VLLIAFLGQAAAAQAEDGDGQTAKLEHLLQAAGHLEKAGRQDLAAEIYALVATEAEADRQRLVDARLDQIRRLEGEVARLQASPAAEDQILVQLRLVEFSLAKLRQTGLGLVSIRSLLESNGATPILDEAGRITEFIELLRKEGLVQVVAEPKLVTVSGRPATLEIGSFASASRQASGEPAASPPGLPGGLRFACTPKITEAGKIMLDIDFCRQTAADPSSHEFSSGATAAGARSLEIKTRVELRSGDTLILAGPRQAADSDEKAVLLLLTARAVGILGQRQPP
jgi:Flp pilus assembly secretin CpaC